MTAQRRAPAKPEANTGTRARRLACVLLLLFAPTTAAAQDLPSTEAPPERLGRNARAVEEGRAALEAYERSEWEVALRGLQRAEELAHSPVFVLYIARAQQQLGAWLEARRQYESITNQPLTPTTPPAWRRAIDAARAEHAELMARLPSVIVQLAASEPSTVVALDGAPLDSLGQEIFVDPGVHRLVARRLDGAYITREFTALAGQKRRPIELSLALRAPPESEPPGPRLPAPPHATRPLPARTAERRSTRDTAAYVTGATGVASLLLGVAAGTLAWSELQRLKDDCQGTRCDPRDASRLDSVRRLGTIADISCAIGAASLGATAILLWVVPAPTKSSLPRSGVSLGALR